MQALSSCSDALKTVLFTAFLIAIVSGCERNSGRDRVEQSPAQYDAIARIDFNRLAAAGYLPLFWRNDANGSGNLEADELVVLTGYGRDDRGVWIDSSGAFISEFAAAYEQMRVPVAVAPNEPGQVRQQLVLEELSQGRPTLVETDLTGATAAERTFVRHLLNAAQSIERLYARQKGVFGLEAKIPQTDPASRMLFHRNQSPFCEAPKTQNEPQCSALPEKPPRVIGLYPAAIQKDPTFCETLAKAPNAAELMDHFGIVVEGDKPGEYRAVPYTEAYREDMENVAKELEAAAAAFGQNEAALQTYLRAAANGFRTNDWEPANAAWVAMNAQNSKWYVRIAPDEVYYEPCAWKAGFALQLARINPQSIEWQEKLDPMKRDMENTLAAMAKEPYRARNVNFKIPDFIDVVLNAGDARSAHGATIGQSLPNWGKVAEKGGRTVAMTNLYTDADSQAQQAALMSSAFCKATNARATTTPRESLISSVLHEAAHNLGPSHEYKVNGKEDDVLFGGTLASTLEELKAQTSAMYLTYWLGQKGIFTDEEVRKIQLRNIAWALGHISRGMYAADGTPRNYSQLAAMQLGALMEANAVAWHEEERAANGTDQGCLEVNFDALPAAVESSETTVLRIKASGDKAGAEQLKSQFVDAQDDFTAVKDAIAERWLRAPKATFVYSLMGMVDS